METSPWLMVPPLMLAETPLESPSIIDDFRSFIRNPAFPCVGAKSALARDQMRIVVARDIASAWDDLAIIDAIHRLADEYRANPVLFQSLAILFPGSARMSEAVFEQHLWNRVQSLSDKDDWLGKLTDPRVSDDPDDPHFSLSFGGEAFFVVGLHPGSSRPARRYAVPVLVFNLHDQFEQLRAQNRYEKLRGSILERDVALAGSINPMLSRHGTVSEARQYSGRAVGAGWQCPFQRQQQTADPDAGLLAAADTRGLQPA